MKITKLSRLYVKIVKSEGTPSSIGRSAAIGLATGLIIPIGLQTAPALILAFILKANKALTWMFTCITNPATVVFIYPVQCWIGSYIMFRPLSMESLDRRFHALSAAETLKDTCLAFAGLGADIIFPFFAGGILFAVIAAPTGYVVCFKLADGFRKLKEAKKQKRKKARAALEQSSLTVEKKT